MTTLFEPFAHEVTVMKPGRPPSYERVAHISPSEIVVLAEGLTKDTMMENKEAVDQFKEAQKDYQRRLKKFGKRGRV